MGLYDQIHIHKGERWCGSEGKYMNCDGNCDSCSIPARNEIEEDKCPYYSECGSYRDRYCYYGDWSYCSKYRNHD